MTSRSSRQTLAALPRVGSASPPGFDDRRAIAVLPFANFSGDPEQEFFADGITEDIISMLAGWRAFPVIARNSTFTYKGKTVDIKKVGEELGVRYVARRQRAQIGPSGTRHGAADPGRYQPSHHGREVRSRPHRSVRAAGRDHPRYRRRDRAGTPQIRTRAHRRAAAAQRGRLRTLSARHVAPLPAHQGGQHRGAGLFPARAGDRCRNIRRPPRRWRSRS